MRVGGISWLAGVGCFAAGAAVWALPGDGDRPNCPVEVAPVMLGIFGASAWLAGLLGLYALLHGRARLLAAPGAFLTAGLCAPTLLLAAIAATDQSAPFGESHPCGSVSVGMVHPPNPVLRTLDALIPTSLREAILVGQGLSFFVPPAAMLGLVLIGAASLRQRALGAYSALPLVLSVPAAGPYLPVILPAWAGFWMANSGYGPALWLIPLVLGFAILGGLLLSAARQFSPSRSAA